MTVTHSDALSRTEQLIGVEGVLKLKNSRVAVFGIGGVGSYVVEALARAGVGALDLIDNDTVAESNLNRQLIALRSTLGMPKVEVAKERILDINPDCSVNIYQRFYLPEEADHFPFADFDYIVDAIDTVKAKISLVEEAKKANVPIICSMGTGNKLDPTRFEVADISKTSVCPLAKVMRTELRKRGINHVKVVYSKEEPLNVGNRTPASISFVPSAAGLIIAGQVIRDLIK
ncbi:MAG: tRNA threonylcarbamoyladenosine dehydratase [Ruminococcaceae bacterium]|nr:tRNA threonylcarbamoyladenosine dehydratase [Oscillospiraceae bacterium]